MKIEFNQQELWQIKEAVNEKIDSSYRLLDAITSNDLRKQVKATIISNEDLLKKIQKMLWNYKED